MHKKLKKIGGVIFAMIALGFLLNFLMRRESFNILKDLSSNRCVPYFNFDQIDYYYSDIDFDEIKYPSDADTMSIVEKLVYDILLGDFLSFLSDTIHISELENIKFNFSVLDSNDFQRLNKIFCERKSVEFSELACIRIYRDILVFKKDKEIVGTAKICFSCESHIIAGTKMNTESFGEKGDYRKLSMLLRKYKQGEKSRISDRLN
jgi:hypothetical protein